jgi:hypothetical protein
MNVKGNGLEANPDYRKLVEQLKKMKVDDAIAIRAAWKNWPAVAIKRNKLRFEIRFNIIKDHPKFFRVFRIK